MEINGIDVSKWQDIIDWIKAKAAGVMFAMIRASLGSYTKDPFFDANVTGALSAGLDVGVYHYFYSKTVDEALAEAKFFLEVIKPYKLTYPVVLDVEEGSITAAGKDAITAAVVAFCDAVEKAGYYTMIYANRNWLDNYLDYEQIKRFDIWLADWGESPQWDKPFGIWQHSDAGAIDGINGHVDLDIAYKDYPSIIRAAGLNGIETAASAPAPTPDPAPAQPEAPAASEDTIYTVAPGDTLSKIASRFGTNYQALADYNGIENPNVIFAGQQIKIPGTGTPQAAAQQSTYTVVAGDNLSKIAAAHNTTYQVLAELNGISAPYTIYPGQVIKLP